jgi:hypothetical protein
MNQLSLNVLAVTIFAMTMSVLLAPVLRISEGWPAGIILAILILTTLDAVAAQSKGSTIFLDVIARFSPEHRDRVLRHEAGHFLVAYQLGFPVTDYSLSAWEAFRKGNGGQGGVQFDATALEAELETGKLSAQMLDRLCMAWMTGKPTVAKTIGSPCGRPSLSSNYPPVALRTNSVLAFSRPKTYWKPISPPMRN